MNKETIIGSRNEFVVNKEPIKLQSLSKKYRFLKVDRKEAELLGNVTLAEFVMANGFRNVIPIKRIGNKKIYIKRNNDLYILIKAIEGTKFRLKTIEEGSYFAELLSCFHRAAEGFTPPKGVRLPVYWGRKMEKYRISFIRFEKYLSSLRDREGLNAFEEYTLKNSDILLEAARIAMKKLKTISYLKTLENSMKNKEVCLNNISSNTSILDGSRLIIKDFYCAGYNMIEEDIALLIRRILEETGDSSAFRVILDKYMENKVLSGGSEDIISALILYPYEPIKLILKYSKKRKHILEEDALFILSQKQKLEKCIKKQLRTKVLEGI